MMTSHLFFFVPGPFVKRKMVRRDISAVHQLWISLLQPQSQLPHCLRRHFVGVVAAAAAAAAADEAPLLW